MCEFQQGAQIIHLGFNFTPLLEFTFDGGLLSAHHRRGAGVVPKMRLAHLGLKFFQFGGHVSEVKDAPVIPKLAR